ncbi:hypothetical protein AGMMS49545_00370 [Betaproteobacteria bacterium]|nr:hypothetical protein AGMMS49545_00370 [Betaproteobacteria bacterium]GHU40773.1 hypothetical protein AGMMS50289_02860 [Betaproteobacteria bacterium]
MNQAGAPLTLLFALLFSLLAHVGLMVGLPGQWRQIAPPPQQTPLHARLLEPPPELALHDVELRLDPPEEIALPQPAAAPQTSPSPRRATAPAPEKAPLEKLADAARRQLTQLDYYPLEAIQNRIQGEAFVQIFLDENGHVIAARIEESSGYPILDTAALKAARALRSLPADGLESFVLPVRFRLTR